MNKNKPIPPKLANSFLHWFLKDDIAEEVQGDLEEKFHSTLESGSSFRAKLNYWYQVFNYLRPFAIKKYGSSISNYSMMYQHNFKIAYRVFKRYKSSFYINLAGLTVGMASALLIFLWVNDELRVDKFHENDSQLYQVMQNLPTPDGTITIESTPGLLAKALADEMPDVNYAASVMSSWFRNSPGIISVGQTYVKASEQYVDKDYFNIFSWNVIHGDKEQVLSDKYAVVLSDELAMKLFHSTDDIIGKSIEWNQGKFNGVYHVSGIFQKPPNNSTAQFDLLFTYELFFEKYATNLESWGNSDPSTFIVLKEGTDVENFNDKIRNFSILKYKELVGDEYQENIGTLFLQRYSDRYLFSHYENGVQAGGRIVYVKLFSMIALFILAIAGINFMNLSTAKASRRMKEIGIKKALGSKRKTIIFQFLSESILMAYLSLALALLLVALLLPEFNAITEKHLSMSFSFNFVLSVLGFALITGIFSGSYPALYLSRLRPIIVLKGRVGPSNGEAWVRKGLVVFQFAISVILIVSVLVVYKQIEFIQSKNLGLNKDNIITFKRDGRLNESNETFLQEVKNMPGVMNATNFGHDLIGNHGTTWGLDWEGKNPDQRIQFGNLEVDFDWIEILGIEIMQGRAYSREFGNDSSKIMFNEAAIAAMGLKDPIGKIVKLWGKEKQIIGVVKNFHFESLYQQVKPCFIQRYPNGQNVLVKIKAGMERETIERLQQFYQEYNLGLPFDYKFLDEDFQDLYASEKKVSVLSQYFAGIAILISCLGLFGLATFSAERRLMEIGIRKILGSSVFGIVRLLSSDFTKIVLLAIVIALPISYYITQQWLESFAFRIDLVLWYFAGAALLLLLIAWITVGIHTIKAARINPVKCLKYE